MSRQTRASRLREAEKQLRIVASNLRDDPAVRADLLARAEDLERLADDLHPS